MIILCVFFLVPLVLSTPIFDDETGDGHLTVTEIITKYGYPAESHTITTSDGYILTLHRIPHGRNGSTISNKPVLLQHGLLSSSADWVITGVDNSLGFILADAGYDVWLGNARGNYNSRNHTTLNPNTDPEFWHFSWHEIGKIDLPAMIDHILETTNQSSVFYAGHSQGTTAFYVMASSRPEYNDKIKAHFSLAPVAYMGHMESPFLRFIADYTDVLDELLEDIGFNEFLPNNELVTAFAETICQDGAITQPLCTNVLFILCGYSPEEMNATMIPVLMGHLPAGSSTRQVVHYGQEVLSGYFRQYDFKDNNTEIYGTPEPPAYELNKITAPLYLFYSLNDLLAAENDVMRFCDEVGPACVDKILIEDENFNHLDFIVGVRVRELVYTKLLSIMGQH